MGSPVLLLRLDGVWQSWGERSRWDVRDTASEPTKSGVIGLLGCVLGYRRGDRRLGNTLDAGLRFGVRIEQPGRLVRDYQTVQGFLPTAEGKFEGGGKVTRSKLAQFLQDPTAEPATIVSPRFYLEEAAFLVGLEERAGFDGLLAECETALRDPVWPVYLGRKACVPSRPVLELLTRDFDGLEDALKRYAWSPPPGVVVAADDEPLKLPLFVEIDAASARESPPSKVLQRRDAVRLNQLRQYAYRYALEQESRKEERLPCSCP